jgi:L-cysteine:1D-myo-inositol 2-amino-2-deoxy-alpha-D-glucopyranoside ligase
MWTHTKLEIATAEVEVIKSALSRELVTSTDRTIAAIIDALANDLDTPAALNALLAWANNLDREQSQKGAGELSRTIDALLGLAF